MDIGKKVRVVQVPEPKRIGTDVPDFTKITPQRAPEKSPERVEEPVPVGAPTKK